jgi:hypothetical protein
MGALTVEADGAATLGNTPQNALDALTTAAAASDDAQSALDVANAAQDSADQALLEVATKVSKTGDTMTGTLSIPPPVDGDDAANKAYVDALTSNFESVWYGPLPPATGDYQRWIDLDSGSEYWWTGQEWVELGGPPAPLSPPDAYQIDADPTGHVVLLGIDVQAQLDQADTEIAGKMNKAGGTMTGDMQIVKSSPSFHLDATGSGDSATIFFRDNGIYSWDIAHDGATGNFRIARRAANGSVLDYPITISETTGQITAPAVPSLDGHVANKLYVDAATVAKVAKAGDTMTGDLTITKAGNPALALNGTGTAMPIVKFQDDGITRWDIEYDSTGGYLEFTRRGATGSSWGAPLRLFDDGTVDLVSAESVRINDPVLSQEPVSKQYLELVGVLKSGSTMTGDLMIAKASAALSVDATGTNDNTVINFRDNGVTRFIVFRQGSDGTFRIARLDAAGAFIGSPVVVTDTGQVNFAGDAGGVVVPAITGASQAAQVTAYDATTGRLAIGGVEMGDTGMRNISTLLDPAYVAASSMLRIVRTGKMVMVQGELTTDATPPAGQPAMIANLPAGFRPPLNTVTGNYVQFAIWEATGTAIIHPGRIRHTTATLEFVGVAPANKPANRFSVTYYTGDAWPATLPGVAA